jgi:hypothetical protein
LSVSPRLSLGLHKPKLAHQVNGSKNARDPGREDVRLNGVDEMSAFLVGGDGEQFKIRIEL